MSDDTSPPPIGGHYIVDPSRPLPGAGGGLPAFAATDRRGERGQLMALRLDRAAPARARSLQALAGGTANLLTPMAYGAGPPSGGQDAWYAICPRPPGPPVSHELKPWPEAALIALVLRPMADVLEHLQSVGIAHRAIRPNNVFQAASTRPITLGSAWTAPPAMHQPAVFEPAYTALCHPSGRSDGRIADDVYALGVLLVTLALGRVPMEGLDDIAIMHRKLDLGDFAAIAGNDRLPSVLGGIVRGMLAEDPDHRPPPALLRDPASARGRRVASRPPARAQRPLTLGPLPVWNTRTLALGMALAPAEATIGVLNGTIAHWLRRGLGDSNLAVKLEELPRSYAMEAMGDKDTAQSMLVMRAVAAADSMMPMCWRGLAFFPEGLAPMLPAAFDDAGLAAKLTEVVMAETAALWAGLRDDRTPAATQRMEARQWRAITQIKGPAGGLPRLGYTLNALTPCSSPLLSGRWIVHVAELPAALDAMAAANPNTELLDAHVVAFVAARSERWLDTEVKALARNGTPAERATIVLRLLAEMQNRYHPGPLTGLASWVSARASPLVNRWRNLERRAAVETQLSALASAGALAPMLALLEDWDGHFADSEGQKAARADLARLDAELAGIAAGAGQRAAIAARLGQEIAAGLSIAAIAATLILAALG